IRRLATGTIFSPSGTGRFPPGQKPFWISTSSRAFMVVPPSLSMAIKYRGVAVEQPLKASGRTKVGMAREALCKKGDKLADFRGDVTIVGIYSVHRNCSQRPVVQNRDKP